MTHINSVGIHIRGTDDIRANNSGSTVWVDLGPNATIFVRTVEEVIAIIEALNDAAMILKSGTV